MAASLIDTLRDCVARRDQLYSRVESLASAEAGDDTDDATLSQHATSPHMTTSQTMHLQVTCLLFSLALVPLPRAASLAD